MTACMLYWAEGYKVGHIVDFVNADAAMLIIFRRFLTEICGIDESRLRGHLYYYRDQDPETLTDHWSSLLSIPRSQFIKPYMNKAEGPGPRGHRMPMGLVHITYCDKKLLRQILSWIEEYQRELTKSK